VPSRGGPAGAAGGGSGQSRKVSLASQFRDQLGALMDTLNATSPHYIRCIKPNDHKQPAAEVTFAQHNTMQRNNVALN
jgi:myosin-5